MHVEAIPSAILLFSIPTVAIVWLLILEVHDRITGRHFGD